MRTSQKLNSGFRRQGNGKSHSQEQAKPKPAFMVRLFPALLLDAPNEIP